MADFNRDGNKPKGKPFAKSGPRKPYQGAKSPEGDRKGPYGRPAPGAQGERKPFSRDGKPAFGERKPFNREGKPGDGERKPFNREDRPAGENRGPYGRPAPGAQGERKPFNRDGKPAFGDRKPFNRDGMPGSGERKPFNREDRPAGENRGPYGRPAPGSQGERKPFSREGKPAFGERKPFNREGRPDGERRPFNRDGKPGFGQRPYGRPAQPGRSFAPAAPAAPQDPLSGGARGAAWDTLNRVLLEDGFASLSLSDVLDRVRLSDRDKRLATNIVYTTLENLLYIDHALSFFIKEEDKVEASIRNLLRLTAAQFFFMDRVPESAAVNEAVKMARARGFEGLTGFVNGVLRNLLRGQGDILWPLRDEGLAPYLSLMHSMPAFVVDKLTRAYGEEQAEAIIRGNRHKYLTIRPNLMLISGEDFEKLLQTKDWRVEKGLLPNAWYVSGAGDISADPDFIKGLFSIQGESSMLAAESMQVKRGMTVLDCCAAPGGKTAYMAEHMQGTGRVQAWDKHEHRVELLNAMAQRLRLYNVRPMMRDVTQYRDQFDKTFDAVLLDAPCSGSGVFHDKPDAKFRLTEEGVQELTRLQAEMMDVVSRYVKPGGTFVYSTCSVLPEENALQVEAFLAGHPDFAVAPLPDTIPAQFREKYGEFGLQLLPGVDPVEGFFIARMVRSQDA